MGRRLLPGSARSYSTTSTLQYAESPRWMYSSHTSRYSRKSSYRSLKIYTWRWRRWPRPEPGAIDRRTRGTRRSRNCFLRVTYSLTILPQQHRDSFHLGKTVGRDWHPSILSKSFTLIWRILVQ